MADTNTGLDWHGRTVVDRDGDKIGSVEEIYLDDQTGAPEWLLVKTGLFGTKSTFIPMRDAQPEGDDSVRVPFEKAQVKDAPNIDADQELSQAQEQEIYSHYGMGYDESHSDSGLPEGDAAGTAAAGTAGVDRDLADRDRDLDTTRDTTGHDTSGPTTDDAMTRSEEELRVGTRREETGSARLRKYVVTENVQTTVPVSREEVRVETEPITDANRGAAHDGPAISEEEHEVVLHEERPVVEKEVVAKERVRLGKDQVTDEHTVADEVRKEQVEVEGDTRRDG